MIKNKSILATIIFFSILIINNCGDNPVSYENDDLIIGRVIDGRGMPVEGVNIHYIPQIVNFDNPENLNKPMPETKIRFSIPEKANVDLVILRYGSRDTIAYLIKNEEMEPGSYDFNFDTNNLTNGVYIYVLKYNNNVTEHNMLLIRALSELFSADPLTKSDENGYFKLPYNVLAIGLSFIRTSDMSPDPVGTFIISDNLSLVMFKDGYQNYFEDMKVDTNLTVRKTFRLKKL